ncbi:MAG: 4Fe-4S ferredoxin [Bacteroidales bacterium]|nr:4Fe-4S ferredoxin [Bacteroidales bacterium]
MKAKRNIIKIDEQLCNGCGICVEGCHEGALQLIDGKARIVSELYCDGLGACIGDCPVGAITIEEREAEAYDEAAVMECLIPKGEATIIAHLKHLKDHGEMIYLRQGVEYLEQHGADTDVDSVRTAVHGAKAPLPCGCPGSMERSFKAPMAPVAAGISMAESSCDGGKMRSQLTHWPVQLHLLNPQAGFFRGADVVLAADCTAYAYADFHNRFIRNHTLAIACPKLDSNKESYVEKIVDMIDTAQINTLTVVIMEVPCCGGLLQLARMAVEKATRKVPVKKVVIGVEGDVVEESWM